MEEVLSGKRFSEDDREVEEQKTAGKGDENSWSRVVKEIVT